MDILGFILTVLACMVGAYAIFWLLCAIWYAICGFYFFSAILKFIEGK